MKLPGELIFLDLGISVQPAMKMAMANMALIRSQSVDDAQSHVHHEQQSLVICVQDKL